MSVANAKEIRTERFGGLNLRDDDIADHEAADLRNVIGKPRGGVRTRDGSSHFAQTAVTAALPAGGRIIDLFAVGYQKTTSLRSIGGGVSNKVAKPALFAVVSDVNPSAATGNGKALSIFGDGTIVDHGAITLFSGLVGQEGNGRLGAATGPAAIHIAGTGFGMTYKTGGASDAIVAWTASAGTIPMGNVLRFWGNRMFITAIRNFPGRVAASGLDDVNYWSTTPDPVTGKLSWTVDIDPGDGDTIVGWGATDTYLVIFKQRRCWIIYDTDTGANRILSPEVGAVSRFAIAETPYGVAFQTLDHSIWLATGTTVKRISEKVDVLLDADSALGYAQDHLYVSNSEIGTLDYDFVTEEWRRHSFVAEQLVSQNFDDGDGRKLFGLTSTSTAGHNLLRYFDPAQVTDAGVAYDSWWQSGDRRFGTEVLKRITELRVEGQGAVTVSFTKDDQLNQFSRTVSMDNNHGQAAVLTPGKARKWAFKFQNSVNSFSLDAYAANVRAAKS